MAYHLQQTSGSLVVRTRQKRMLLMNGFLAIIAGLAVWFLVPIYFRERLALILGIVTFVTIFLEAIRTKRAELTVTSVEFRTKGNFNTEFRLGKFVSTADIRWLEFQLANNGDSPADLSGLYAATSQGNKCVLPFVDEKEANRLIAEIEKKFPGLAENWGKQSPYNEHFLELGITERK